MARLVPIWGTPLPKKLGLLKGRIKVPDDFNAPLPDKVLDNLETT